MSPKHPLITEPIKNRIGEANDLLHHLELPTYSVVLGCLAQLLDDARALQTITKDADSAARLKAAENLLATVGMVKPEPSAKHMSRRRDHLRAMRDDGHDIYVHPPSNDDPAADVKVVMGEKRLLALLQLKGHAKVTVIHGEGRHVIKMVKLRGKKIVFCHEKHQPDAIAANRIGGVLTYRSNGHRRRIGDQIGTDGAGDYAVILKGTKEHADKMGRQIIRQMELDGHHLESVHLVLAEELVSGHAMRFEGA